MLLLAMLLLLLLLLLLLPRTLLNALSQEPLAGLETLGVPPHLLLGQVDREHLASMKNTQSEVMSLHLFICTV